MSTPLTSVYTGRKNHSPRQTEQRPRPECASLAMCDELPSTHEMQALYARQTRDIQEACAGETRLCYRVVFWGTGISNVRIQVEGNSESENSKDKGELLER